MFRIKWTKNFGAMSVAAPTAAAALEKHAELTEQHAEAIEILTRDGKAMSVEELCRLAAQPD